MRICYVADGRYIHARRWMSYFRNHGHDMHLVSFAPLNPEQVQAFQELGIHYHGAIGGFHVKRWWLTLRDLRFLKNVLRRERIDILHSHYLSANSWYAALTRFHPLVITVMGGGDVTGPDWKPRGKRESLLTPYTLRAADVVTSWSKVMADVVRPYCRPGVPVEPIHGGVDVTRCYPGPAAPYLREKLQISPDMKVVFSPRLMRPLSNIMQIANAAALINQRIPNVIFLFAAPGEERDTAYEREVQGVLSASGLLDQARFVGAIAHDQIADYHRLADVTVSIPTTDGTPMTVLESMACGTPVVCGDIPDYDRQYFEPGQTVLAAKVDDAEAIANAVVSLLEDQELAGRIAAEARRRVTEIGTYEAQMSRMEQLYYSLVRDTA